jgi:energy-coupling factor transport system ATP-binding protein
MSQAAVSVKGLTFTYQGNLVPAISDINLQVEPGELICITGSSGCGKSTLALCLAGFIPHHVAGEMQGSVTINGMDTRSYSPAKLAGRIGLVQQDPEAQLCTLRVVDEVAFGPENLGLDRAEIRERVDWALRMVNSGHLLNREVYSLSGGEKQRIAIASVLAMQPSLIILDEPTANLDPVGAAEVLRVIKKVDQDTSVIVIEHRLKRLLPVADRLVMMEQGRIAAQGEPEEVYRQYSQRQYLFPVQRSPDISGEKSASSVLSARQESDKTRTVLKVRGLGIKLGDKRVLDDISFDLYSGDIAAVMGGNGSGKTSLLLSLLGINKIDQGSIMYHESSLKQEKVSQRARNMGMVFQNPNHQIFENTVWKEAVLPSLMLLGETAWDEAYISRLLLEFDLLPYRQSLPFSLSLGEKKRLTLVSVLGYQPEILLLDEPLIGQDNRRADIFWRSVEQHRQKGGITIMVCHDPDFVQEFCNRILFFDQGKLLLDKPVEEGFLSLEELGFIYYLPGEQLDLQEG